MLCGDLNGKEMQKKKKDICIGTTDSLCCTEEAKTTLESNYTKKKERERERAEQGNNITRPTGEEAQHIGLPGVVLTERKVSEGGHLIGNDLADAMVLIPVRSVRIRRKD